MTEVSNLTKKQRLVATPCLISDVWVVGSLKEQIEKSEKCRFVNMISFLREQGMEHFNGDRICQVNPIYLDYLE